MTDPIGLNALVRLQRALKSLPVRDREIFLAHRLDALSYAEIAQRTGLSIDQVEESITRAIIALDQPEDGEPRQ